ncbi:hypothetical protein CL1_1419 [Thermococcus cleftensis]|uniref:Uncharacterized protein n=1 Tax=Thermococcus cleftensis (strain DSM 27260 / KACC 17922 / CL1) TaxID=163003 RepID=I3ZV84_THECF|nr:MULTISPECIES: hypothetical protein [Thermococcus]AFL95618.1 hypothetical protein CL1_1419 [Thermococcus cleftensis]NJE04403.1 hypothetical protein [Thermococcus sp. MV11]
MRLEVLSREDMNALSRELSRAGIMNRTKEEISSRISHYVTVDGTYAELLERAEGMEPIEEALEELRFAYDEMLGKWEVGEERNLEELFDESNLGKLVAVTALIEAGAVEEKDGKLVLREKVPLEVLRVELRFPIEDVEEYLEELEKRFEVGMVTEYTLEKRYFVEVMEVEGELIEAALEIAEEYATEESLVNATFEGIARSVLANVILELAERHRRKNELIEAIMEREPIVVEEEHGRVNIYFDEDAIEDFLKELQTLGYLKVKGNRIWV